MKKLNKILSTVTLLTAILSFNSCIPDPPPCVQKTCTTTTSDNVRSINGFDYNISSAYYNQVVANFKFTQTTTNYTAPNDCSTCPTTSYSVKLLITNETNKIIHFDYSISFVLNFASWNYQGVATINPYGTLDVGQISNSGTSVTLGQFTLQSTNITYQ